MSRGYLNKNNFGSMPILSINVSNPYVKMPELVSLREEGSKYSKEFKTWFIFLFYVK